MTIQAQNSLVTHSYGFVSDDQNQANAQRDRILNDKAGRYPSPDAKTGFFSNWNDVESRLGDGVCVVVTDLSVISEDCDTLAERLLVCFDHRVRVVSLDVGQCDRLSKYYRCPGDDIRWNMMRNRCREELRLWCQKGWKDDNHEHKSENRVG